MRASGLDWFGFGFGFGFDFDFGFGFGVAWISSLAFAGTCFTYIVLRFRSCVCGWKCLCASTEIKVLTKLTERADEIALVTINGLRVQGPRRGTRLNFASKTIMQS